MPSLQRSKRSSALAYGVRSPEQLLLGHVAAISPAGPADQAGASPAGSRLNRSSAVSNCLWTRYSGFAGGSDALGGLLRGGLVDDGVGEADGGKVVDDHARTRESWLQLPRPASLGPVWSMSAPGPAHHARFGGVPGSHRWV
jgi:hypothetical protein